MYWKRSCRTMRPTILSSCLTSKLLKFIILNTSRHFWILSLASTLCSMFACVIYLSKSMNLPGFSSHILMCASLIECSVVSYSKVKSSHVIIPLSFLGEVIVEEPPRLGDPIWNSGYKSNLYRFLINTSKVCLVTIPFNFLSSVKTGKLLCPVSLSKSATWPKVGFYGKNCKVSDIISLALKCELKYGTVSIKKGTFLLPKAAM